MSVVDTIFLGWDAHALPVAAACLLRHYDEGGEELDLARAAVVLPGARAGRRLAELLLEQATRLGRPLVPPEIATLGRLPELLYQPELPLADGLRARLAWVQALRALPDAMRARLFPHVPAPADLAAWVALARTLEHLHRELGGAGLAFGDVGARLDGLLFDDRARWQALTALEALYLERLAAVGCADREWTRRDALEGGRLRGARDIWLVGVPEMPPLVARMLAAAPAPVRVLVHAPLERAPAFGELGCVRPDAWRVAEIPLADERLTLCDRPADQAAETLRAIAELGRGRAADEVVVGVPDPEVVPYLEERLGNARVPVRYAGDEARPRIPVRYAAGTPVSRTAPPRLLAALADYLDGRRFDALAALVRHPDVTRWLDQRLPGLGVGAGGADAAPGIADDYFGQSLPAVLAPDQLAGLVTVRARLEPVHAAIEGLAQRLDGERRMSEWAPVLLAVLAEVLGAHPLDRAVPAQRQVIEACERLRAAAVALHELPAPLDAPGTAPDAIRLLLDEVEREAVPPEADAAAVELLGWLELHLDDAPVLVVTGVNEPFLPESEGADAFLPDALRARLGLPDSRARYARDAYLLTAMLSARPDTRLIGGRRNAAGDPLRPSRLLFASPPPVVAARVLRFYDAGRDRSSSPRAPPVLAASGFALPPEPEIRAPQPLTRLSVTQFKAVIADPYRFALQHVLGIESQDDAATELDPRGFGTLAHRVLGDFGLSAEANVAEVAAMRRRLDAILDQEVARRFGSTALAAVYVQVEQLRWRLHEFADWQARWIAAGWRIEAVEVAPPKPGVDFPVDGEPFLIDGRVDRVDSNPSTGEWAIFDYKTGGKGDPPEKTHRTKGDLPEDFDRIDADGRVWIDLQLPLYRHLLPALERRDGTRVYTDERPCKPRLGYLVLPSKTPEAHALFGEWDDAQLAHADEEARRVIRFVRRNRFVFDRATDTTRADDELAALLGVGQLAASDDDAGGEP